MKALHSLLFASLSVAVVLTGCKKDKKDPDPVVKQSDQAGSGAVDGALDDVNDFINNKVGGGNGARVAAYSLPCGVVSIDSSGSGASKTYAIKYGSQTRCHNVLKNKSGQVSIQLSSGTAFNQAGAKFIVKYTDYVVENVDTKDKVTINGILTVTNVTGGFVWQTVVANPTYHKDSIQHRVHGSFNVTYANNEVRPRKYYQLRTWSSTNGWSGLTFSVAGDTTLPTVSGKVSETGRTYDGDHEFNTQMLTDFSWSNCGPTYAGPYVLISGDAKMNVTVPGITPAYFEVLAGYKYDISSQTATSVGNCDANAYKIDIKIGATSVTQYQLY